MPLATNGGDLATLDRELVADVRERLTLQEDVVQFVPDVFTSHRVRALRIRAPLSDKAGVVAKEAFFERGRGIQAPGSAVSSQVALHSLHP